VTAVRVVIVGVSTRAAAESAARAGFDVTAIDAFADVDQHSAVRALGLPGPFSARAAAAAARGIECDAVAYLSNFENHPAAVRLLTANRTLWGNPPEVLSRVRDPLIVAEALSRRGFAAAKVRLKADAPTEEQADLAQQYGASGFSRTSSETRRLDPNPTTDEWLLKPIASGGGHGIQPWQPGDAVPRGTYLQQFVDGTPGSVVFAAAAGRAVPLGVFRQLVGDREFGTDGCHYCGNILAPAGEIVFGHDDALVAAATELAGPIADAFGLVGVNGIDFIARDAIPHVVEINPRWCASMELVERAYGLSVFGAHASACAAGTLPDFDLARARRHARATLGKAVVFARHDVTVGDTRAWSDGTDDDAPPCVRDIPRTGTRIGAGRPICTVFADASTAAACYAALVARAGRVYECIG
jgi:predicted ATP-grasp superfamily ATP-dependent carboligase